MSVVRDVEVVVVGAGAFGAAALYQLARDGREVVGLEQFAIGHSNGSSHGRSRAIRTFYNDPLYAGLARAALPLWRELEATAGERLLHLSGSLFWARRGNPWLESGLAVAEAEGTSYELLAPEAVGERYPILRIPGGRTAVLVPEGGFLDADQCVAAMVAGARRAGAQIHDRTPVRRIELDGPGPLVVTDDEIYRPRRLVLAGGAWLPRLVPELGLPLHATRQAFFTFRPGDPAAVAPDKLPVFADYDRLFYGFPDHGPGLKIADDTPGPLVTPETVKRSTDAGERAQLTTWVRDLMPAADLAEIEAGTCLYTVSPDHDFLLGPYPGRSDVFLAAGLDHGFKFSILFGRLLADLVASGRTAQPIERFRLDRFRTAVTI